MKFGDQITGKIDSVAKNGSGLIRREQGKPVGVYNTIPGETVKATFIKRTKDVSRARLEEVVDASPDRVQARCPYAGTCGGCKWQHVSGDRQRLLKKDLIQAAFDRHAVPCPVGPVAACPESFYYRNRMDYVFGRGGELGLKMPDRWWATLDLETCFLLSPESVEILNRVRAWTRASGLPFWDSKTHRGFFRYLVIREGKNTGERMVMLVTSADQELPHSFVEAVGPLATSVVHGINARLTDLSIADEIRPLKGDPWIYETVNGIRYKVTPNAFFQTNSIMAAELQKTVQRMAGSGDTLLDLYCGSGFFSLSMADRFKRIVGIELDAEAIACAKENAIENAVQATYVVSAAEAFDWSTHRPDVVIVDPPRAGMHPDAIATLIRQRPPVVIYVSCSVERFVKEWIGVDGHAGLSAAYRIAQAEALDLFPHTPHVECVFRLERIDG